MNTAMILCAGFGTRMKDLTKDMPKPMLSINNKPLLEHTLRHLASLGITNIVINLHYKTEQITSYFQTGEKWGVRIHYSFEEAPLGTAGAVKKVEHILEKTDAFLVLYGDIFCTQDYADVYAFHRTKHAAVGTIVLHERNTSNSVVEMDDTCKIIRFIERPEKEVLDKKQKWVNSGLYCFNKKILAYIPKDTFCDFPKDIFGTLVNEKTLYGYPLKGYRCAVDSKERYEQLQHDILNLK